MKIKKNKKKKSWFFPSFYRRVIGRNSVLNEMQRCTAFKLIALPLEHSATLWQHQLQRRFTTEISITQK